MWSVLIDFLLIYYFKSIETRRLSNPNWMKKQQLLNLPDKTKRKIKKKDMCGRGPLTRVHRYPPPPKKKFQPKNLTSWLQFANSSSKEATFSKATLRRSRTLKKQRLVYTWNSYEKKMAFSRSLKFEFFSNFVLLASSSFSKNKIEQAVYILIFTTFFSICLYNTKYCITHMK